MNSKDKINNLHKTLAVYNHYVCGYFNLSKTVWQYLISIAVWIIHVTFYLSQKSTKGSAGNICGNSINNMHKYFVHLTLK